MTGCGLFELNGSALVILAIFGAIVFWFGISVGERRELLRHIKED